MLPDFKITMCHLPQTIGIMSDWFQWPHEALLLMHPCAPIYYRTVCEAFSKMLSKNV